MIIVESETLLDHNNNNTWNNNKDSLIGSMKKHAS